jgi:hypothetical protein
VTSDIGAMSLGRWHSAQFFKNMGATSLLNVTSFLPVVLALPVGKKIKQTPATKATASDIENTFFIKLLPLQRD